MHSVEELGANVPAFLAKLWKIVEDPDTNDLICWGPSGSSFFIRDQARFARELLPSYYKHNNMASFVRQLNMYGFHKVVSIESGGLKIDRDEMEFAHQCFLMGHPYLLEHIKRKIPTNKAEDGRSGSKPELMNKVLLEVKGLKGRQDDVDSQLNAMKRENEVLWREVAILRQKHIKQQQIVNKLIQFLVSMVQSPRGSGIGIKRHYPLMLNDSAHRAKKPSPKRNGNLSERAVPGNSSPTGPVIHELDPAELLDDCTPVMEDENVDPEFITSDLCGAAGAAAAASTASTGVTTGANSSASTLENTAANIAAASVPVSIIAAEPTNISTANSVTLNGVELTVPDTDVLLEFAEEYPLSPGMVTIPSNGVNLMQKKTNKGKQKSAIPKGNRRRKLRLPCTPKSTNPLVTIKRERTDPGDSINVNQFLEIMLPNLVTEEPATESVNMETDSLGEEVALNVLDGAIKAANLNDEQSSLEAATDAAISAISSVASQKQANNNSDVLVQNSSTPAANSPVAAAPVGSPSVPSPLVTSPRGSSPLGTSPFPASPITTFGDSPFEVLYPAPPQSVGSNYQETNTASNNDGSNGKDTSRSNDMALACSADNFKNGVFGMKEDLDVHVDSMQSELDTLKELLKGDSYSLDANMLLGVCAAGLGLDANTLKLFGDESLSYGIPILPDEGLEENKRNGTSAENLSGSELMTYSSNLLDLADMTEIDNWGSPANSIDSREDSMGLNTPVVTVNSPCFSGSSSKKRKITK